MQIYTKKPKRQTINRKLTNGGRQTGRLICRRRADNSVGELGELCEFLAGSINCLEEAALSITPHGRGARPKGVNPSVWGRTCKYTPLRLEETLPKSTILLNPSYA